MGYNKENYARIRAAYQTKYLKAYEEADRRAAALHAISPELAKIDRQLAGTGAKIALAAMGTGEDHRARLAAVEAENKALQARRAALLTELGYPVDYTKPVYECPLCEDSGFVNHKMCECMRRELVMAAYECSGLGQLMRTQSFESFDLGYYRAGEERDMMARNVEILRAYADNFGKQTEHLILCGATGLGKTHLSTSLAKVIIERGYNVVYTTAIRMFDTFEKKRFSQGYQSKDSTDKFFDCDLLIIDDLGCEMSTQFTVSTLYDLINTRLNEGRSTVISTNLSGAELRKKYDDRITSRLFGHFVPLPFSGTDIRQQKLDE